VIFNDHNVYILGAGYSRDAGLPLIAEFTNRMRDSLEWFEQHSLPGRASTSRWDLKDETEAIRTVLEFRRQAGSAAERVPLNLENIEELFSLAAATGDVDLNRSAALAIAATIHYAVTAAPVEQNVRLLQGTPVPEGWAVQGETQTAAGPAGTRTYADVRCPLYDLFALEMAGFPDEREQSRADAIITFNYDTLVEDGLSRLKIPFSYGFEKNLPDFDASARCVPAAASIADSAAAIHVLKPHGSINWALVPSNKRLTIFGAYEDVRKQGLNPLLVPPTWRKDPTVELSDVWDDAVSAVRSATRIIIVGYSIPPTDLHFKYLIAAGLRDNNSLRKVFFVNPQAHGLRERLAGIFRADLTQIMELVPADTRSVFTSNGYRDRFNRRPSLVSRCAF